MPDSHRSSAFSRQEDRCGYHAERCWTPVIPNRFISLPFRTTLVVRNLLFLSTWKSRLIAGGILLAA